MAMSIKFSIKKNNVEDIHELRSYLRYQDPVEVKKVEEVKTIETVKTSRDDMQKPLKIKNSFHLKKIIFCSLESILLYHIIYIILCYKNIRK